MSSVPVLRLNTMTGLLKLVRPKQWVKNAFVIMPLVFSGNLHDQEAAIRVVLAFVLFCLASSATYVMNDIHDVERDRKHPKKSKTRPIASGTVSIHAAILLLCVIVAGLLGLGFLLPSVFKVVGIYICLNVAYTFVLKHEPVIDIFVIATGFVLRVYAGTEAVGVELSGWMAVTTLCLALYLASVKRLQELAQNGIAGRKVLEKYSIALVNRYAEMSATGALLFYSLFVISTKPQLVLTVPLVLFGLFRYWYVVEALDGGESPTDALFVDWQLLSTVLLWLGVCGWVLWSGI